MEKVNKGYVQVYTGNGKGKTTAALGLALRAACANKKVYIGQFLKGMDYSELRIPEFIPSIKIEQYGSDYFIRNESTQEDKEKADIGFSKIKEILKSDEYDIVIMDEITHALYFKLVELEDLIKVVKERNPSIEVIMTGRNAPQELIDFADLVTEMKEIKHYYTEGVMARVGIEN